VALIELFAWMTEMTLFRLNQVPDSFYVRFLNLMGVEPFPPAAALAELTFWLAGAPAAQVVVPAGTQVSTGGEQAEHFVFTTVEDLVVSQPRIVAAMSAIDESAWLDVSEQLAYDRASIELFRSTYSHATSQPNPGTVCKKARWLVRLNTNKAGPVKFKLWSQTGDGPITSKVIDSWAAFDGNGFFKAEYSEWTEVT